MKMVSSTDRFKALDACHQQILQYLANLTALLPQLETDSNSEQIRKQVRVIEAYFSHTARQHHAEEEKSVFPPLLLSQDAELVQVVHTLHQDHGWIEQNWLELSPMLRAIAQGEDWVDMAELRHTIEVFVNLCNEHITLEETLIYPHAKEQLAAELAGRAKRLAQ
ncbi:hemerythrin domain-containing protein [Rhodoferax sp.]|uniref:hemerythrin domain-containing protein n=1 Tax=Rhodoferax sp. TaxID=50421 RepID=UPI002625D32F|nr:hemerythrin domain-containing protein [Rhodoferax sp.]MDD2924081.1 hemerythrin domain-containing protein [Rhodoferax sp.]